MTIIPFMSVGDLHFSDTREVIRRKLNCQFEIGVKEFGKVKEYYDYFTSKDLFIFYDENNRVNAFEFFDAPPIYEGLNLLQIPFKDLLKLFGDWDSNLIFDGLGFTSNKTGIGIGAPNFSDDPNCLPESVIVFRLGYYG